MEFYKYALIILGALALSSLVYLLVSLYKFVHLDARVRHMPFAKVLPFLSTSSSNGSGLLAYLFLRRKYISHAKEAEQKQLAHYKQHIFYSGTFYFIVSCIFIILAMLYKNI